MRTWNECQYLKSIRDNDQIPIDPSLQSIFNCHSIHGKCQYYRPAHFFHSKCGIHNYPQIITTSLTSKSLDQLPTFQETLLEMIELQSNKQLWQGQPPILIPFVSYMNEMKMAKSRTSFQRHNLSFIHVHKTGGTTIHMAMRDMNLYNGTETILVTNHHHHNHSKKGKEDEVVSVHIQHYKKMYDVYSQLRILRRSKMAREKTNHFFNKAVRYQPRDHWDTVNPNDLGEDPSIEPPGEKNVYNTISKDLNHMMFALVRDPVERFISAVGQVTSSKFSKKGSGLKLKNACISSQNENELSTSSILKCFVNVILEKGYWVDVHFTPMILEISFATLQRDVPVALFHFDSLPDVVHDLGLDPRIKKKNGKQEGYRQELLVNATVEDFDFNTLRDLCHLYLMDVLLMRDLGYSTHCDSIVFQ